MPETQLIGNFAYRQHGGGQLFLSLLDQLFMDVLLGVHAGMYAQHITQIAGRYI